MTGEYAHSRMVPGIEWRMSPAERTMADEFNDAGYETIYVGKWHLYGGHLHMRGYSSLSVNRTPVPRKYQGRWEKWMGFKLRNGPFDTWYSIDDNPTLHKVEHYQTDGLFDLAMDHIGNGRDKERPFCCCISVEPPHPPMEAPAHLKEKWLSTEIDLPPNFEASSDEEREDFILSRQIYYAMVENLDMNVGRLLRFMEDQELEPNTVILFLADHGELRGSHGLVGKQHPYEESVGIPLIVVDPSAKERAGTVIADPTNTEDLFPTVLGLAGLTPKNPICGENLTPLIRGAVESLDREGVLLEFVSEIRQGMAFFDKTWRAVRTRRYEYVVSGDILGAEPFQFFDLEEDPYEMTNLIGNPSMVDEIKHHHQLLRNLLVETEDDYVLKSHFGIAGLNEWRKEDEDAD